MVAKWSTQQSMLGSTPQRNLKSSESHTPVNSRKGTEATMSLQHSMLIMATLMAGNLEGVAGAVDEARRRRAAIKSHQLLCLCNEVLLSETKLRVNCLAGA